MNLFLIAFCVGIASAAKLPTNNYLPPPTGAIGSGGHGGILQGPNRPGGHYLPPTAGSLGHTHGQASIISPGHSHPGHTHPVHSHPVHSHPVHSQAGHAAGYDHGVGASGYGHGAGFGAGAGAGHYHSHGPPIPILKYENVNNGDGSYHFDYATGNGITHNEEGYLNNPGSDYAEQVVQGSYSYTGDDGHVYTVHYKADANGFQATGDHLPTPPPIPEAIQKSLIYNAQHAHEHDADGSGGYDNGHYRPIGEQAHHHHHPQQHQPQHRPQSQYLPPSSRPSFSSNAGYHY